MKHYLLVPARLAALSAMGLAQVVLVTFGCLWVSDQLVAAWPWVKHLRSFALLIGLVTLVYPAYIVMAMSPVKRMPLTPGTKYKASNKTQSGIGEKLAGPSE